MTTSLSDATHSSTLQTLILKNTAKAEAEVKAKAEAITRYCQVIDISKTTFRLLHLTEYSS
jgi:hypothetical protein